MLWFRRAVTPQLHGSRLGCHKATSSGRRSTMARRRYCIVLSSYICPWPAVAFGALTRVAVAADSRLLGAPRYD
jgi:hypothetical protein